MEFARPKTRGELVNRLKNKESCEVAAFVDDITSMMLRYWLDFTAFKVVPSENEGWVVYVPIDNPPAL